MWFQIKGSRAHEVRENRVQEENLEGLTRLCTDFFCQGCVPIFFHTCIHIHIHDVDGSDTHYVVEGFIHYVEDFVIKGLRVQKNLRRLARVPWRQGCVPLRLVHKRN